MTLQEAITQAMQAHQAGDLGRAESLYRAILAANPNYPDALNLLGVVALQTGRLPQALELIGRAIDRAPATASFHFNLGLVLAAQQKLEQAIAAFRGAVECQPDYAAAWSRLGDCLYEFNQPAQAAAACRRALDLQPDLPDALNGMGKALHAQGDRDQAITFFRRAVELLPTYSQAASNLGQTLCECAQFEEALTWSKRAVELQPDFALPHWNLSLMLLRLGDWENGFREYEWRWRMGKLLMPYPQPMWDGAPLNGKRILLHGEQGAGDTIQFIRYLPHVAKAGGHILVAAQKEIVPLLRRMGIAQHWLVPGDPLPAFDMQCALTSLAGFFKTTPATVPADLPYVTPDLAAAAQWRDRFDAHPGKRIGLAWTGNPQNPDDANRSIPVSAFAPLAAIAGVTFFSLQKGPGSSQGATAPMPLIDWTDELSDFSDTAAMIDNLDLLITADTAVAHLAGAMGKPVWILLPRVPDWRWLLNRSDSPWYPTARLFRQETRGDWSAPIQQAAQALRSL